jgi:hypothetical protein
MRPLTLASSYCPPAMQTPDPPGRRETIDLVNGPAYGWKVITAKGGVVTIRVYDLERWRRCGPYQWLNKNPQLL